MFKNREAEERKLQEKRDAMSYIIVGKLEDQYNAEVKETEESDEFVNFEDYLLETDRTAIALYNAKEHIKESMIELKELLADANESFDDYAGEVIKYNPVQSRYTGYVRSQKAKAFPKCFRSFDRWRASNIVDSYLRVYDDFKEVDKIVAEIVKRASA